MIAAQMDNNCDPFQCLCTLCCAGLGGCCLIVLSDNNVNVIQQTKMNCLEKRNVLVQAKVTYIALRTSVD